MGSPTHSPGAPPCSAPGPRTAPPNPPFFQRSSPRAGVGVCPPGLPESTRSPRGGVGEPGREVFSFPERTPPLSQVLLFLLPTRKRPKKKQKAPVGAPPGPPRGGVRPPAAPTAAWPDGTATIATGSPRWGQTRNVGTPPVGRGDDIQSREGDRGSGTANSPLYRDRNHPSPGGHRSTSPGPAPPRPPPPGQCGGNMGSRDRYRGGARSEDSAPP